MLVWPVHPDLRHSLPSNTQPRLVARCFHQALSCSSSHGHTVLYEVEALCSGVAKLSAVLQDEG